MTHNENISKLKESIDQQSFVRNRDLSQYICVRIRPDICATKELIPTGKEETTKEEMKAKHKFIDRLTDTKNIGIPFAKIEMPSIRLVRIRDATFGNSRGFRSQRDLIVLFMDKHRTVNIIHY